MSQIGLQALMIWFALLGALISAESLAKGTNQPLYESVLPPLGFILTIEVGLWLIRGLHQRELSSWCLLIGFFPVVGPIIFLILWFSTQPLAQTSARAMEELRPPAPVSARTGINPPSISANDWPKVLMHRRAAGPNLRGIQRLSYDSDFFGEENEVVDCAGTLFTGIVVYVERGILDGEVAFIGGVRKGYDISYHPNGTIADFQELSGNAEVGLYAEWTETGTLIKAKTKWLGLVIETLEDVQGQLIYRQVASEAEKIERRDSKLTNMYPYRQESIYTLLAEAEHRIKTGTVFDDPRLVTGPNPTQASGI